MNNKAFVIALIILFMSVASTSINAQESRVLFTFEFPQSDKDGPLYWISEPCDSLSSRFRLYPYDALQFIMYDNVAPHNMPERIANERPSYEALMSINSSYRRFIQSVSLVTSESALGAIYVKVWACPIYGDFKSESKGSYSGGEAAFIKVYNPIPYGEFWETEQANIIVNADFGTFNFTKFSYYDNRFIPFAIGYR